MVVECFNRNSRLLCIFSFQTSNSRGPILFGVEVDFNTACSALLSQERDGESRRLILDSVTISVGQSSEEILLVAIQFAFSGVAV